MNEAQSNEGYTYTRTNGTVEHAPDLETAHKMCPILGQMSLEQAGIMLKMGARGRAVAEQKEAKKAELEQADDSAEGDMFDMPSIYDDLIAPVEAVEVSESIENDSVEVDTLSAEPREFKSFLETLFERSTKELEQVAEPKETRIAETKTIIEPALTEKEVAPEVVKEEIIDSEPEVKESFKTVEVQQGEVAPEAKTEVTLEVQPETPAKTPDITNEEVVVEKAIENTTVIPQVPEFVSEHAQPEVEVEITQPEVRPEIDPILPVEQKSEVEAPIDTFIIPEMIMREQPVVEMPEPKVTQEQEVQLQPIVISPEIIEAVEPTPAEKVAEEQVPIVQTTQKDYIEQPVVIETIEEAPEVNVPIAADELIIETPEAPEEIMLETPETLSKTEQSQIQNTETEAEEEKHTGFVPIVEDIEPASTEEEDLIEQQVVVAMTASTNTISTNKVSKLLGMFATLLHIEYTPA